MSKRTVQEVLAEMEAIEAKWSGKFMPPSVTAQLDRLVAETLTPAEATA